MPISELSEGPEPAEPTSANIHRLLHGGWSPEAIKEGLRLAAEVPWGTKVVEEVHASAATVRKFHHEMAPEAVRIRAFFHLMRRVAPHDTAADRQIAKVERQMEKAEARCPSRAGPRHMLIADLCAVLSQWKAEGRDVKFGRGAVQSIVRGSGKIWEGLSAAQIRTFEKESIAHIAAKEDEKEEVIAALETRLDALRAKRAKMQKEPGPLTLTCSEWRPADLDAVRAKVDSDDFQPEVCALIRELAERAPDLLPSDMLNDIKKVVVYRKQPAFEMPLWLKTIAQHRDEFEGSAVSFVTNDNQEWVYAFMFARKDNDFHSEWFKLTEQEIYHGPVHVTSENWGDVFLASWARQFEIDFHSLSTSWQELPRVPVHRMRVLHNLEYIEGALIGTDHNGQDMDRFLSELPAGKANPADETAGSAKQTGGRGPKPKWLTDLISKYPWLEAEVDAVMRRADEVAAEFIDDEHDSKKRKVVEELTDEQLEAIWDSLARVREAVSAALEGWHIDDFPVTVLGGGFTAKKDGRAFDNNSAAPRKGSEASKFVSRYFSAASARFDVPFYTLGQARTFGATWSSKMQHFWDIYQSSGDDKYIFTKYDRESFIEPEEFQALFDTLAGKQLARAHWLRNLQPR